MKLFVCLRIKIFFEIKNVDEKILLQFGQQSRILDGSGGLKLWRESVTRPLVSRQGGPKFLALSPSPSIHIHIDSFLQFFFRKILIKMAVYFIIRKRKAGKLVYFLFI